MNVTILVTIACIVTITKVKIKCYRRNTNLITLMLFSSMSMTMCETHEKQIMLKLVENSFQPHEVEN